MRLSRKLYRLQQSHLYRLFSYSRYYRTGTSLRQQRLIWGVLLKANDINLFLMIFPHLSLHCKLVPVQYRKYDINLFLMIFPHMSLHCKLVPVQYREYDINLFLMTLPLKSLHCKLVPVQYREYDIHLFLRRHA